MKAFGLFIGVALLAWTSLIYVRLRIPRHGMLWLPVKLAAANFALETTVIGIVGAAVGVITGSFALLGSYALLAVAPRVSRVRTWLSPQGFTPTPRTRGGGPPHVQRPRAPQPGAAP